MASSTYRVWALASTICSNDLARQLAINNLLVAKDHAESLVTLMKSGRDSAYARTKLVIFSDSWNQHTCRETMISSIVSMQQTMHGVLGYYNYPHRYAVVEYMAEGGEELTEEEMDEIITFMISLNGNFPYPITATKVDKFLGNGGKSLLFFLSYDKVYLHTLSFLLYIFRFKKAMRELFPLMNPRQSFKTNMLTISKKFAENPDWGWGDSNPAGNLALYAYILARGTRSFHVEADGPVNAAARFHDIAILMDFVKNIVGIDKVENLPFSESLQGNISMIHYFLQKEAK